jgi:Neurotransmitter-gated ion-channel ligand binding domain/Neurotransmitter-gated ion-channel transmembrane region
MIRLPSIRLPLALAFALASCVSTLSAAEPPGALPPAPPRPGAEAGSTKVSYVVWIGDVTDIDSVAQTFSANLMLILRWHDPQLRHAGPGVKQFALSDIWHPPVLIVNEAGETTHSLPEVAEVASDGSVVSRQRLIGTFTHPLDLRAFPFDRATFRVQLVLPGYRPQEIEFEPDAAALAAGLRGGIGRADQFTLQDWRVLSTVAGSKPYAVLPGLELAGFAFEFTAARNAQYFVIKVILPLLLIVMMSWSVFWIDPTEIGPQFSIAVTSMLTLIAYRFAIESNIPKLPYLTRLDAFILTGTLLVFLSLIEVIVVTKMAKRDRLEQACAIDRRCRWIIPLVFALATGAIFVR